MGVMSAATLGWGADSSDTNASDPLLDLFIKKGFVTQKEAEQVEAEAEAIRANESQMPPVPLSRWKITQGIKSVQFFGDIRLRYEDREAQDPGGDKIDLQRFRYAVRVGLRGDLVDNLYYGFRVETSANPRSSFVTLGTASAPSSSNPAFQGPFGKSTASLGVGQIYLGWRPWDWVDITLGKMPNPLYTTPMVWSGSLNPEGVAERFKYTIGEADFFATFGQFLYQDTNPTETANGYFGLVNSTDLPFLLAWQGGVNYHITKQVTLKVAPVLYQYTSFKNGQSPDMTPYSPDFSGTYVGQGAANGVSGIPASYNLGGPFDGFYANQTGINDLLVLEFPVELNIKLEKLNLRFFGDYAQNLEGASRARAAYNAIENSVYFSPGGQGALISHISSPQTGDVRAYQVGFGIGSTNLVYGPMEGLVYGSSSKKHAWEFRTYWQHIEQYALDVNLLDSDFFEGRANLQGFYTAFAYSFTDAIIGTIRYGYANQIKYNLGTGGNNLDLPGLNPIKFYNLFQLDLTWRF